ncbi:MAG: thiamine pyrophosphate-dependent dehydrogenase E1 component subunit alpha [Jatrophihabitantaceae bacterium]
MGTHSSPRSSHSSAELRCGRTDGREGGIIRVRPQHWTETALSLLDAPLALPDLRPFALIDPDGTVRDSGALPDRDTLLELYRRMVIGRRFDAQATALTKQGRLAVYPSSRGQEACEVAAVLALGERDWLFPTYRDCVAIVTRSVDPVEVLSLLRGEWHCGYDPNMHRVAPQCTPLATNTLHGVGLAHAARLKGEDAAVLVLLGDGATSEGDTHEALNFAAVWHAPVVFLVQNNGYAISVPLSKQTAAPSLAHKAIGYGMPGRLIDGNDPAGVYVSVKAALDAARRGEGPTLIEGVTYRIEAHTNADDATRYRSSEEVQHWLARDPLARLDRHLRSIRALDDDSAAAISASAEAFADDVRTRMNIDVSPSPDLLFDNVYAEPTAQLNRQHAQLRAELSDD